MRNYVLSIEGGIGKCVAATAVCKAIKDNFSDANVIVVSAYPEVFLNNPNVNRSLQYGAINYFYNDYINDKDFKLMAHNPYLETNYVNKSKHLIEVWCEMNSLPFKKYKPEIFLNQREIDSFQKRYQSDKPIFLLQMAVLTKT